MTRPLSREPAKGPFLLANNLGGDPIRAVKNVDTGSHFHLQCEVGTFSQGDGKWPRGVLPRDVVGAPDHFAVDEDGEAGIADFWFFVSGFGAGVHPCEPIQGQVSGLDFEGQKGVGVYSDALVKTSCSNGQWRAQDIPILLPTPGEPATFSQSLDHFDRRAICQRDHAVIGEVDSQYPVDGNTYLLSAAGTEANLFRIEFQQSAFGRASVPGHDVDGEAVIPGICGLVIERNQLKCTDFGPLDFQETQRFVVKGDLIHVERFEYSRQLCSICCQQEITVCRAFPQFSLVHSVREIFLDRFEGKLKDLRQAG